uniref:Uncharacterized protein n=1 Tax=Glossina palpalis gambiensis TaxID=67801 RepID=A0A1B0C4C3_9MUSC
MHVIISFCNNMAAQLNTYESNVYGCYGCHTRSSILSMHNHAAGFLIAVALFAGTIWSLYSHTICVITTIDFFIHRHNTMHSRIHAFTHT